MAAPRQTLTKFKAQVRETAIRLAKENDVCDDGLNDFLSELGLPEKDEEYHVTVTFRNIEAADGDAAEAKVRAALSGAKDISDDAPEYDYTLSRYAY